MSLNTHQISMVYLFVASKSKGTDTKTNIRKAVVQRLRALLRLYFGNQ